MSATEWSSQNLQQILSASEDEDIDAEVNEVDSPVLVRHYSAE